MESRTVEEFVEDLVSYGRDCNQIRAVARSSRWENQMNEIEELLKKYSQKSKKIAASLKR